MSFFIENHNSLASTKITKYDNFGAIETQELRLGVGFSLGRKHIFGNNMILEHYTGSGFYILENKGEWGTL